MLIILSQIIRAENRVGDSRLIQWGQIGMHHQHISPPPPGPFVGAKKQNPLDHPEIISSNWGSINIPTIGSVRELPHHEVSQLENIWDHWIKSRIALSTFTIHLPFTYTWFGIPSLSRSPIDQSPITIGKEGIIAYKSIPITPPTWKPWNNIHTNNSYI